VTSAPAAPCAEGQEWGAGDASGQQCVCVWGGRCCCSLAVTCHPGHRQLCGQCLQLTALGPDELDGRAMASWWDSGTPDGEELLGYPGARRDWLGE
jgi:hypothetical protein